MSDIKTGGKPRRILIDSEIYSKKNILSIEGTRDAKYVCETCLVGSDGQWLNFPVAIFYQDEEWRIPEGGSAYFGVYQRAVNPFDPDSPHSTFICNAISATEHDIEGLVADNGDVVYSRYRWDHRYSPDGSVWIDGGRDYTRWGGRGQMVTLRIVEGELRIVG